MFPADVDELLPSGYKALYYQNISWLPWGKYMCMGTMASIMHAIHN